jgi:hypothetical protein
MAPAAFAAPLSDDCKRVQGKVTCTTFEGPGNNQAGVGNTTTDEGQGNVKNTSPEKGSGKTFTNECGQESPMSAKGDPITCD